MTDISQVDVSSFPYLTFRFSFGVSFVLVFLLLHHDQSLPKSMVALVDETATRLYYLRPISFLLS